jgi:hypothetical protein
MQNDIDFGVYGENGMRAMPLIFRPLESSVQSSLQGITEFLVAMNFLFGAVNCCEQVLLNQHAATGHVLYIKLVSGTSE